ncbi:hypothetical protein MESS2_930004 [Mesorhizobium metallidurans STM 2683]|uniref:Uncharacterized protein n=1 Tax=Mesorhizobium metallidurans STM 2683 TaxID=1297569 RepID=M5FBE7_9HYPH|nr:hypothetical protein MESS2_930004 [Mesorhizobium metallidurans STM 2683]
MRLSETGDSLEKLNVVVPWEVVRKPLAKALKRSDGAMPRWWQRRERRPAGSGPRHLQRST